MVVSIYIYVHDTKHGTRTFVPIHIKNKYIKSWSSCSLKPIAFTLHLALVECLAPSHNKTVQALICVTVEGANDTGGQVCIVWDH